MSRLYPTAIYIRLSREDGDREESDSVSGQKKLLLRYIEKHAELLLYNMYIDDGYSGLTFHRPGFMRMLADIEERKVSCVIVKDLSRFGRDYIESGRYLERYFPEKGIRFISVSDHIDSLKQEYDLLLPIKNVFNEQYARDISGKVRAALRTKQQCGEFIGAFASYGYRKSPSDKNKLVIDPYAASVVRRIFSLYLKGFGKQEIARLLNAEGILCPSEYKRAAGLRYANPGASPSSLWSYSTINHILHKEIYAGNMVQGTRQQHLRGKQRRQERSRWIIVPGTHEPIIDAETWTRTQQLLKSSVRSPDVSPTPKPHLFAGLLFCADCGRPMVRTGWKHADGSPEYSFTCGTCRRHGKTYCSPHTIPARALEQAVLHDLNLILAQSDSLPALMRRETERFLSRSPDSSSSEPARLEREHRHAEQMLLSCYEDYRSGLLSGEEFLSCRTKYRRQAELALTRKQSMEREASTRNEKLRLSPFFHENAAGAQLKTLDRALLSALISRILVFEDRRIRIFYTFSAKEATAFPCQYSIKN